MALKGVGLLLAAELLRSELNWPCLALASGLLFGSIKARYLFSSVGKKNLLRIDTLSHPKLWQFYRLRFFFMLAIMIVLGITLSQLAQGSYLFLLAVGVLDLSIATALIGSSYVFGMRKVFF